jgi:Pectate lyase superfamily protein
MRLCFPGVLGCSLILIGTSAQAQLTGLVSPYSLQLSLQSRLLALSGPANSSVALQSSIDLTNWTTLAVVNPTFGPTTVSLDLTQPALFLRSPLLSSWSIGGFSEALDLKRDFRAIGDGITDDTAAVQAMLNSTMIHSNAVVFVPPGTYRVTQTCKLGNGAQGVQPRLAVVGLDATQTFFRWDGTNSVPMFQFTDYSPEFGGITMQSTTSQFTGVVYSAPQ